MRPAPETATLVTATFDPPAAAVFVSVTIAVLRGSSAPMAWSGLGA